MSLATICKRLAVRIGVQPADSWLAADAGSGLSDDLTAAEVVAAVQDAQQEVARAHTWQVLHRDAATIPLDAEQVAFALPPALARIVPGSVRFVGYWGRILGPLEPGAWAQELTQPAPTPHPVFTVQGGKLLVRPGVAQGQSMTFAYVVDVPDYASDDAVSPLGEQLERLIYLYAVFLYRDSKGLPSQSAWTIYQNALPAAKADDMPVEVIALGRRMPQGGGAVGRNTTFILDESRMI